MEMTFSFKPWPLEHGIRIIDNLEGACCHLSVLSNALRLASVRAW